MQNTGVNYRIFHENVTFRVLFTEGGTLWKKVPKRCPKVKPTWIPFGSHFRGKVSVGTLLKNMIFLGCPQNGGIWAPRVPKGYPKGRVLEVFLVPFQGPVPKVKTVFSLEPQPHLEGFRVP